MKMSGCQSSRTNARKMAPEEPILRGEQVAFFAPSQITTSQKITLKR